jgi:tetratricopeptide (TPR) repeat protein
MFDLKPISAEAIPQALKKAERYRLLNEPAEAESICLDVLAIEPDNQPALVMLLLALTDQFRAGPAEHFHSALAVLPKLTDEYERLYFAGLIWERHGHARALQGGLRSGHAAYEAVRRAMDYYERAEQVRPPENDDAILRWNTCVRLCQRYHLAPEAEEVYEPVLGDD